MINIGLNAFEKQNALQIEKDKISKYSSFKFIENSYNGTLEIFMKIMALKNGATHRNSDLDYYNAHFIKLWRKMTYSTIPLNYSTIV